LAEALAFRPEEAKMAPARLVEIPCFLAISEATALKPGWEFFFIQS